jgi:ATP-binding cassette subfamily C (CFTR/MRP) protein 1
MMLEGFEKRAYFIPEYQNVGPEESSGFYGQSILWWLHGIIVLGGRQVLKPTDLYPISKDMSSEELGTTFWKLWTSRLSGSANPPREIRRERNALTNVLFRMFWGPVLIPVVPRLSLIGFTLCQALLLKRLLSYLSSPAERQNSSIGIGLVGAYAIIYLGIAVISYSSRFDRQL